MAAPMDLRVVLHETAENVLNKAGLQVKKVSIVQRSNDFKQGDFVIPAGCFINASGKELVKVQEDLQGDLVSKSVPIEKVSGDKHNPVSIHLHRPSMFKQIIKQVLTQKMAYATKLDPSKQKVIIHNKTFFKGTQKESQDGSCESSDGGKATMNMLRSALVHQHAAYLLSANGYQVVSTRSENMPASQKDILKQLDFDSETSVPVSDDLEQKLSYLNSVFFKHRLIKHCEKSELSEWGTDHNTGDQGNGNKQLSDNRMNLCDKSSGNNLCEDVSPPSLGFNLRQYIRDRGLRTGRSDFDKNLSICNVCVSGSPSEEYSDAFSLYLLIKKVLKADRILHIASQASCYNHQKVLILLDAMLQDDEPSAMQTQQQLFVHGPVSVKSSDASFDDSADTFISERYAEMLQAAVSKYGESVHGEGWSANLEALTIACVKFELLGVAPRSQLKLALSDTRSDLEARTEVSRGSFVMYNCARLATLFRHFEEAVEHGTYPPLPEIDDIDFATLREEEEWALLFAYVYPYPEMVRNTLTDYVSGETVITNIHTHKICQMLGSLSRCLSSYYSRYHVLAENRAHMLPTMYARIYLLKSVYQIMEHALGLMGIQPLSQL